MNSRHLQPEQVAKLRAHVARDLAHLTKLCERAKALGWPDDDSVVRPAIRARNAMAKLAEVAHYAGGANAGDQADGR